jgi:hypothetical protein
VTTDAASAITLRALDGEPLAEQAIREMVVSTARAIAERQGVRLRDVHTTADSITATLDAGRIEAVGFAAELRRLTGNWYRHKFGADLWGDSPTDERPIREPG